MNTKMEALDEISHMITLKKLSCQRCNTRYKSGGKYAKKLYMY